MYAQTEDYLQQKSDSKRTVSSENLLTEDWKTPDHVKVYVLNAFSGLFTCIIYEGDTPLPTCVLRTALF